MTWWKALIAAVLALGVLGITAGGLKKRPPPALEAQFAKSRKTSITRTITGAGKVNAVTTVKISSNLSGDLVELGIREGDAVKKGQVLGKIDRRKFEASAKQALAAQSAAKSDMRAAQVELNRAIAEYGRGEGLAQKGLASGAELSKLQADRDSALARLSSARERYVQAGAAYDEAENNLSKTTLISPIDGNVIELTREVGERVRGSDFSEDVVMTLAALSAMEVKVEVGEHEVVYLREGQKADVAVDALEGQIFPGTVTEVAQKAIIKNPGTEAEVTTFPIKVTLNGRPGMVLPGMSAEVRIASETHKDSVVVPIQAVTVRAEKSLPDAKEPIEGASTALVAKKPSEMLAKVVFVVDSEGRARIRRVRTGIATDTELEILEGLQEGEKIVEGPYRLLAKDLKDGDWVKEMEPGKRLGARVQGAG
jgi:HlyD family secretion protein